MFKADAVNEEDSERDRAAPARRRRERVRESLSGNNVHEALLGRNVHSVRRRGGGGGGKFG